MKRILLILALLISGLGLNAQSATIGDLEFTITSENPAECEVSGYSGEPVNVTIPSTVTIEGNEYAVTSIGNEAFFYCSSLTSIEIPSGVTSIGELAFSYCSSLTSVIVESGNTVYDSRNNCNAIIETASNTLVLGCKNTVIPSGVTSIGNYAFYGCSSLTSIEIPSAVTSIGESAFSYCSSLTSIEIPSGVTSIGKWAFWNCSSLTSIEIPSGVTSIGDHAFSGCSSLTSIEIPSGVTSIGGYAFSGCSSLTSIEIPSGVTSIGGYAFSGCSSLTSIEIPSGVTSIGEYTFYRCSSLTSIEIPSGVTSIGKWAFWNCSSLTSIEIPSGVTSIGDIAFSECSSLTSVTFGESSQLTSIGEWAFSECSSLTSIEIPSGVTSIGEWAFNRCSSLTSIEIPSGVTSIGNEAFARCSSLTSVIVESGNTVYDSRNNCNAIIETATNLLIAGCQNTIIPNSVTSIGNSAFKECSSLTSIEIPSGVTSIGDYAFSECSSLTSVTFGENSQLTSIGGDAFDYCSSLTSIEIPSGVTSIGNYAFRDCSSLTSIEIPSAVTSIGNYAFRDCSSLENIVVKSGNTIYDSRNNCNAIIETATNLLIAGCQNTIIPNSVTTIGDFAFSECSSLTSIEIPSGVTEIGGSAFWYCSSLKSVLCHAEEVPRIYYDDEDWYQNPFFYCPSDMVIYVPAQSVDAYKAARPWNYYTILAIDDLEEPGEGEETVAPVVVVDTVTETTVVLVWNAVDSATSYNVYMDTALVASVTDTTYTVEDLTSETTYSFTVTALADTLESVASNVVTVTTLAAEDPGEPEDPGDEPEEPIELDVPENVEANAISTSSIIITWDNVENALSYNVYRNGELLDDIKNTSYTDKDLEYNTEYCYTVEAVNGKEKSEKSEEVCVKTLGEGVEELSMSFNIYPNPVNDKLYIETEVEVEEVVVYDVFGRQQSTVNGQQTSCIDVTNLNSGVYFVKVITTEGDVVKRFVKK